MVAHIFVTTPTHGSVKVAFMKSVLSMLVDLSSRGIGCSFDTEGGADIALQRNLLVRKFLNDQKFTHILMIDSDMAVPAVAANTLLEMDKPFCGMICTRRSYNYSKVVEAIQSGVPPQAAHTYGFEWLTYSSGKFHVDNDIAEVSSIGFGCVLIARAAFETMTASGSIPEFENMHGRYRGFFHPRREDIANNEHFGEDVVFCRRWRIDCGGRIWAYAGLPVYHIGDYGFGGAFKDHWQTVITRAPPVPG